MKQKDDSDSEKVSAGAAAAPPAPPAPQAPPAPRASPAPQAPPAPQEPQAPRDLTQDQLLQVFLTAASRLGPDARSQMMRMGISIPDVVNSDTEIRFGYLCTHCGKIALEFVGTSFVDYQGVSHDTIPVGVRFADLPWRQNLPQQRVNRMVPNCQHCHQHVTHDMYVPTRKRIVDVQAWSASRIRAREERSAMLRRIAEAPISDVPTVDQPTDTWVSQAERDTLSAFSDAVGLGNVAFPQSR